MNTQPSKRYQAPNLFYSPYRAYGSVKAYKIALLKDLAGLTIDGIFYFAKSVDIGTRAALDWISSSEKSGFYTHWAKVYKKRFPVEKLSVEAEEFGEMIRHLAENDAVRNGTARDLSRALQQRPNARANQVGYDYLMFISILASVAGLIIGLGGSALMEDLFERKWGTKFETYINELNKYTKEITTNLSSDKKQPLLNAIDNLNLYLSMLSETLDQRHYKKLHTDIDAAKSLLREEETGYYFSQLGRMMAGKKVDFDSFEEFSESLVEDVIKPVEEIIVHLEKFKTDVDNMEEPTRKFKRAAIDLRKA